MGIGEFLSNDRTEKIIPGGGGSWLLVKNDPTGEVIEDLGYSDMAKAKLVKMGKDKNHSEFMNS